MNILTIHSIGHDAAISYFRDYRLRFTIETERLTRVKHDHRAKIALRYFLENIGPVVDDIDIVVTTAPLVNQVVQVDGLDTIMRSLSAERLHRETTCRMLGRETKCLVVLHEAAHAALAVHYAAYPSRCLVLVNEGRGAVSRSSVFRFHEGSLRCVETDPLPWYGNGYGWSGLGYLFGFGKSPSVAGRLMALAGYSASSSRVREILLEIERSIMSHREKAFQIGEQLMKRAEFSCEFDSMTTVFATLQEMFTEQVCEVIERHLLAWPADSIGLSGGCALNLPTNSALRSALPQQLAIPPACNDAGQSLGAGVYAALLGGSRIKPFSVYSNGLAGTRKQVVRAATSAGMHLQPFDPDQVARQLARGAIVAVCSGTSELGPRALGARSLLANPYVSGMRTRLSESLKGREWFRPLGAAMRLEQFRIAFPGQHSSPHMLFSYGVERGFAPEARHVDGTCRLQTVDGHENPQLEAILRAFEAESGNPVLINTSLNRQGRAIAYQPSDVIDDFGNSDVDLFVFDDCMAAQRRGGGHT